MGIRITPAIIGFLALVGSVGARADMIRSDSIGNDPAKEKLCFTRANNPHGHVVPFEIDSRYLAAARAQHADVTFVAIQDTYTLLLYECYLREGTGRYEPAAMSPPQWYWHLFDPDKPEQFKPGLDTREGKVMAATACLTVVPDKINRPNFDHSVYSIVDLVGKRERPLVIGGKTAGANDITVTGQAFYGPASPDLSAVNFTCLLSPMLEFKALQYK